MNDDREDAQHPELAEHYLQKALASEDPSRRLEAARSGLESSELDETTHVLLLRQCYLAHLELGDTEQALDDIQQALKIRQLEDVCHQDAARALVLLDRWQEAAGHLRRASRVCPADRRAFHLWTLGSGQFLQAQYSQSEATLRKAMRWATTERPLIAAQLTLALRAQGKKTPDLQTVADDLESVPSSQGYGQLVLGLLHAEMGNEGQAVTYLRRFIERTEAARTATRLSLLRELKMARQRLQDLGQDM